MSAFIFRRLLLSIPTLFGVLVIAFLLLYVAPGDPVMAMVGERADEQTIARLRAELRLDDPLPVQFGHYVAGIAKGDLGRSYITNRPIRRDILERFPKTLQLAGAAMLRHDLWRHARRPERSQSWWPHRSVRARPRLLGDQLSRL